MVSVHVNLLPREHIENIPGETSQPGNSSVNKSSDKTPTSPLRRSSSRRRAEMAGRSRRLLRLLLLDLLGSLNGFITEVQLGVCDGKDGCESQPNQPDATRQ